MALLGSSVLPDDGSVEGLVGWNILRLGDFATGPSQSKRVQMVGDVPTDHYQDGVDLVQPFPHPIPFDLKSVAVVDDMAETSVGAELARLRIVE